MPSENDLDYSKLYGELRAALLSRHFALGKFFRANLLSLGNNLLYPYPHANDLRLLAEPEQTIERWRIDERSRENALMDTGRALTCMAIEHLLGRADSKLIIHETLKTLASLYKFSGNHFDGYIIRWDPATSDRWDTDSCGRLQSCYEFLIGSNGDYLYSTPLDDPRYTPMLGIPFSPEQPDGSRLDLRWRSLDRYRRWEPSMDEIVGLVSGYFMVYQLLEDQSIRSEIRRQLQNLGDYLAEYGYIMVKPGGGFSARPSGHLPSVEFPFGRVFERIVGNAFPSRASFEDALVAAGVWPGIKAKYDRWSTAGSIAIYTEFIVPILSSIGLAQVPFLDLFTELGLDIGVIVGRAMAMLDSQDCFDVWDRGEFPNVGKQSFAAAYLLKQLPPVTRFMVNLRGALPHSIVTRVCLTSLDDQDDQTVRTSYLNWFQTGFPSNATAIAVLLGAGEEVERSLTNHIANIYNKIKNDHLRNLELLNDDDHQLVWEDDGAALDYLETLALAWLHVWRCTRAGIPVNPDIGLPGLPDPSQWPPVAVPKAVYDSSQVVMPRDAIQNRMPPSEDSTYGYNLYSNPPPKPVLPPPVPRVTQYELAVDKEIVVRESDGDVDTEIDINSGDRVIFDAQGEIWAGILLTSNNGPEGWWNIDTDRKFPLPGWHPYGLLGHLDVRYFPIGRHYEYPHHTGETKRLYLRINDDQPGNGNGEFTCHIQVWRERPIPHLKADHRKLISLETLPGVQTFEVAVRNEKDQPLMITGCRISPANMQPVFQIDLPPGGVTVEGCNRVSISLRGTFCPTTPRVYSATLEIISNDPTGVFPIVALFGFAGPPQALIEVHPTRLDLRAMSAVEPGMIGGVTIENRGNRPLQINAINLREDPSNTTANAFNLESETPVVLNFFESSQFSVSFDPSSADIPPGDDQTNQSWQYRAEVLIDSNADNGPHPFTVTLQGLPPRNCDDLAAELSTLQEELRTTSGIHKAAIIQQINAVKAQMHQLSCG